MRIVVFALLLLATLNPVLAQAWPHKSSHSSDTRSSAGTTDPVWLTQHGKKFHRPNCRMIQGPHDVVHKLSRAEARRRGFQPCRICKP